LVDSATLESYPVTRIIDMLKKVLIASVAVVVALLAVNYVFPKKFADVRLWVRESRESVEDSVPPEREIARLKADLENLAKEDERHFHRVAVQIVEVQKLEKEVAAMRTRVSEEEGRITAMTESYDASRKNEDKFVSHNGEKHAADRFRDQLHSRANLFQVEEKLLDSKQEQLSLRQRNLETNRKKLSELKLVRQQMKTELERLEAALLAERQAQAAEKNTLDDASYQKLRRDLDNVRDKVEVLKQKQILKGEVESPVRVTEQRKQQEAASERFLDERFRNKK